ncbi:MAG: hypothetical protein IID49_10065 [Proteobacteria bacterium]|nr:hypothetical protein [Pseudomonadota bacterium]
MFNKHLLAACLLALLIFSPSGANALSRNLEELLAKHEIIMPDLAARYPDAEAVILLDVKEIDQSRIINPVYTTYHTAILILKEAAADKFRSLKIPYFKEVRLGDIEQVKRDTAFMLVSGHHV